MQEMSLKIKKKERLKDMIGEFSKMESIMSTFIYNREFEMASSEYNKIHSLYLEALSIIEKLNEESDVEIIKKDFDGSLYIGAGALFPREATVHINKLLKYNLPDKEGYIVNVKMHSKAIDKFVRIRKRSIATEGEPYPNDDNCVCINGKEANIFETIKDPHDLAKICSVKKRFNAVFVSGAGIKNPEVVLQEDKFPDIQRLKLAKIVRVS